MTSPAEQGAPRMPARAASRLHRPGIYAALGSGALLGGALAYIGLLDPHKPDSIFPACPFRLLTGWNCPACGGLRMMHDLMHGHLAAAITDNVFLLVGLPMLAGWFVLRRRSGRAALPIPVAVTVVVAALAWTVLRNLPGFPLVPTLLTT